MAAWYCSASTIFLNSRGDLLPSLSLFYLGGPDGSGGWFAPEVYLKGRKTMAVDLFSAGCMIFWVASDGLHPFDNNPFNVVQGHYQKHVLCGKPEVTFLLLHLPTANFSL